MRILVVEDSAKMAALLKLGLEREGYAVDVTASAVDAVWLACEHGYDVVVLDVILDAAGQQADGFEVCRRLRQAGCWVPVLMVTARDAVPDRVHGLDAGANNSLPTPFHLPEFLARVRALIRRGAVARPAVLTVGDLSLDPARHEVRRAAGLIGLTRTEFALLEYLMRHAGEALTRRRLVEHVWDYAFDGDPRIVDVYVRTLREKIDRPYRRSSLQTVRGTGYRIHDDALDRAPD